MINKGITCMKSSNLQLQKISYTAFFIGLYDETTCHQKESGIQNSLASIQALAIVFRRSELIEIAH